MYIEKTINLGNVIEVQKYTNGRFSTKAWKKEAKRKTPETQLKWKSREAVRKVWRMLRDPVNFSPSDLWTTLNYPAGARPDSETVRKNIKEFLKRLRREYRKQGKECKYIFSVGRGKRGAIHLHFVLSKIDPEIITVTWRNVVNQGEWTHVYTDYLDRSRNWHKIAKYIIKNGEETFTGEDPICRKRFCHSKNLRLTKPRTRIVKAKTWKKEPSERAGYYIDKGLSYEGTTPEGYPYQYTVYVKLGDRHDEKNLRGFSEVKDGDRAQKRDRHRRNRNIKETETTST